MTVLPLISVWSSLMHDGALEVKAGVGDSMGSPKPVTRSQDWNACQCTASSGSIQQNTGKPDRARNSSRAERMVVVVHRKRDCPVLRSLITLAGIQEWTKDVVSNAP